MKLEEQVVSLELAKKLKELGAKQDATWWWVFDNTHTSSLRISDRDKSHHSWELKWRWWDPELFNALADEDKVAAFSTAELGELLPTEIEKPDKKRFKVYLAKERGDFQDETRWFVEYQSMGTGTMELECQRCADTEADARAKMLIYLVENGLVKS
jgi:hypothetical protein